MEDPLAAFADMLEDDDDDEGTSALRELDDYGRLYEYNNGMADFAIWEGVYESRPRGEAEMVDDEVKLHPDVSVSDEFGEVVASTSSVSFFASPSPDTAPPDPDPELRSEMQELMSIFDLVYENKSAIDTRSLLKKCIYMCERIMDRYPRLPQVVAMHEQAKAKLQMFETGGPSAHTGPSNAFVNFAAEDTAERSFRTDLIANVKDALDSVDRDTQESNFSMDPDEGREVNGVYSRKGIWYCRVHIEREQCRQCGVDYRLLNQVHRSRTEEAKIDDIIRKEQQRLEELERQALPRMPEGPTVVYFHSDAEDFQSIAKDLNEELARAREKDKVNSLKCFASFPSSEERRLVL